MYEFEVINLNPYFTNHGFTFENNQEIGNLSLGGSSLPGTNISFDIPFQVDDIPFQLGKNCDGDNVEMSGQVIAFKEMKIHRIHVLGVSNNGDFYDWIYLSNNGKQLLKEKLYLSDFVSIKPSFNDKLAISFPYLHSQGGIREQYKPNLWLYSINVSEDFGINQITLEDNPFIHIFAITIEGRKV
jgi:hypothetical protein